MTGMSLDGSRVAVITGGAAGIGAAMVAAFAERGVRIAVIDRDESALAEIRRVAGTRGWTLYTYAADVADWLSMATAAQTVLSDLGQVDVLCNNAGVAPSRVPVWEQDAEDFERVIRVNLLGVRHGIRAFVPHMVERRAGHVVSTGSYLSLVTRSGGGNAAYAATKHAIAGLSEVLAEELAFFDVPVGVSVVCPGPVATPLQALAAQAPGVAALSPTGTYPPVEPILDFVPIEDVARATVEAVETGRRYAVIDAQTAQYVYDKLTERLDEVAQAIGPLAAHAPQ